MNCSSDEIVSEINGLAWKSNIPISAILELTRKCNLHCIHCYATPEKRPELTFDEQVEVLRSLKKLGTLWLTFTGGDPTVNKDFMTLVKMASSMGFAVQIFTNGVLIDEEMCRVLSDINVFHVGLSVYGSSPEVHDAVTKKPGSFKETIRTAVSLNKKGVYTVLKYVFMNTNVHDYENMVKMSNELGIPYKIGIDITARDDTQTDTISLRIALEALAKISSDNIGDFKVKEVRNDGADMICGMGRTLMSINAYGDVFGCIQLPIPAGNVRYSSLEEIWKEAPFLKAARKFPDMEKMHTCTECGLRSHCNRCPGDAFTENLDVYGPTSAACRQALVWRMLETGKPPEELEIPPGLKQLVIDKASKKCLPGWTRKEILNAAESVV